MNSCQRRSRWPTPQGFSRDAQASHASSSGRTWPAAGTALALWLCLVVCGLPARTAVAQTTPAEAVKANAEVVQHAAACSTCHGTDGRAIGVARRIAAQSGDELLTKLLAFRDGSVPSTVMGEVAKGFTTDELRALSNWFARVSATGSK